MIYSLKLFKLNLKKKLLVQISIFIKFILYLFIEA
jgi:hypothetical protein